MGWISEIWNALWGALATPFAAADNALLGYVTPAIEYTPNLSTPAVQSVWVLVYAVFLGALGIAVTGIGLMYILSPVVERRAHLRHLWTKLAFALVLGSSSMLIGNFTIDLANQLTQGLLGGVSVSVFGQNYWGNSVNALGPGAFVVYLIALIFILMVLLENGVRILMIFFAGALLPWGFLLWSFPTVQSYGTKIIRMFFEWTFVSVFMAVALAMTFLLLGGKGTGNDVLDAFLFLAGLALVAAMPKVMMETGQASVGIGASILGGIGGAAGGALGGFSGVGLAAGAAGMGEAAHGSVAGATGGSPRTGRPGTGSSSRMMGSLGRAGWMMAYNPIGGAGAVGGMVGGGVVKTAAKGMARGVRGVTGALHRRQAVGKAVGSGLPVADAQAIAGGQFSPKSAGGNTFSPPSGGTVGTASTRGRSYLALERALEGKDGQGLYRTSVRAHEGMQGASVRASAMAQRTKDQAMWTRQRVLALGSHLRQSYAADYAAIRQRVGGRRSGANASAPKGSEE